MPLQIHRDLRTRLLDIAAKAIPQMRVEKGKYLRAESVNSLSAGDAALDGRLRTILAETISEHPFSGFVAGHLYDQLARSLKYDEKAAPIPLNSLSGYEDVDALAASLIDAFVSLPWRYTFIYPLPLKLPFVSGDADGHREFRLREGLSLVCPGRSFAAQYEAQRSADFSFHELLITRHWTSGIPEAWQSDRLYLVHTAEGFVTGSFSTQLAKEQRLLTRTLGGLLEATGLVDYHYVLPLWGDESVQHARSIYSFVERNGTWHLTAPEWLDAEHAERLQSLQWDPAFESSSADDKWLAAVTTWLRPAFENGDATTLLRRCCQWHFDSQCGNSHLLQFVQATVAVEILLGDKASSEVIGLGELLANRCAYSLARNAKERQELLDDFKRIYDTRSQIVHRGKAGLSKVELEQLWRLMSLGRRLIVHELRMLRPSAK